VRGGLGGGEAGLGGKAGEEMGGELHAWAMECFHCRGLYFWALLGRINTHFNSLYHVLVCMQARSEWLHKECASVPLCPLRNIAAGA
jgi:hypothetical protein